MSHVLFLYTSCEISSNFLHGSFDSSYGLPALFEKTEQNITITNCVTLTVFLCHNPSLHATFLLNLNIDKV
jgi:hypothetical protein